MKLYPKFPLTILFTASAEFPYKIIDSDEICLTVCQTMWGAKKAVRKIQKRAAKAERINAKLRNQS